MSHAHHKIAMLTAGGLAPCLSSAVGGLIFGLLAMSVWASFVTRWPYNLSLTLANYAFSEFDSSGWSAYWNSLELAAWTAEKQVRRADRSTGANP